MPPCIPPLTTKKNSDGPVLAASLLLQAPPPTGLCLPQRLDLAGARLRACAMLARNTLLATERSRSTHVVS